MKRRSLILAATGLALLLGGCAAGELVGVVDQLTNGSNDGNFVTAVQDLSYTWRVNSYTGNQVGAVTVPSAANLRWTFRTDFSFDVTSTQAVSVGSGQTYLYNESGRWRLIDAKTGQMGLTVTQRAGVAVPTGSQVESQGLYSLSGTQLVLTTDALGFGSVRYVMSR